MIVKIINKIINGLTELSKRNVKIPFRTLRKAESAQSRRNG